MHLRIDFLSFVCCCCCYVFVVGSMLLREYETRLFSERVRYYWRMSFYHWFEWATLDSENCFNQFSLIYFEIAMLKSSAVVMVIFKIVRVCFCLCLCCFCTQFFAAVCLVFVMDSVHLMRRLYAKIHRAVWKNVDVSTSNQLMLANCKRK